MSEIRILEGLGPDGPWETGPGTYESGLLHLPGGGRRGVEDFDGLVRADPPDPRRRAGIATGLRTALAATGPLPRPLDLAASFVGLGLGALGGTLHATAILDGRFSDGARVRIVTDPATAAAILRDRDVIRGVLARRDARLDARVQAVPAPQAAAPLALPTPDPAPALTSIFAYEMRKGRLRRLASEKAPEETCGGS